MRGIYGIFGLKLRKYDLLAHLELNLGFVVDYLI